MQTEGGGGHRAKARRLQQVGTPKVQWSPGRSGTAHMAALGQKPDSLKDENIKQPNPSVFPLEEHFVLPSGALSGRSWESPPLSHCLLHPVFASCLFLVWLLRSRTPRSALSHSLTKAVGRLCCCSASGGGKTLEMAMSTIPWHSSA